MSLITNENFGSRDILRSPPILEALIEVRCETQPNVSFSLVPGALYNALQKILQVHEPLPFSQMPPFAVLQDQNLRYLAHHRFKSSDSKKMVQVGPNVFTANILAPYSKYEDFEELIKSGIDAYQSVVKPQKIVRVGLRYINLIKLELAAKYTDPILIKLNYPQDVLGDSTSQTSQTKFLLPGMKGELSLTIGLPHTVNPNTPMAETGLYIDLDVFWDMPELSTLAQVIPWAKAANIQIINVFKSILNPDLYGELKGR